MLPADLTGQRVDPKRIHGEVVKEMARQHFLPFVVYTFPEYHAAEVHKHIAWRLEAFERQVRERKSPRLIIETAPRVGKSELVSRKYGPWVLGRNPDWSVILASYGAELAEELSGDARRLVMSDEYAELFGVRAGLEPGETVELERQRKSVTHWRIANHRGGVRAVGVGGAVTGRGAHCFPSGTMIATEDGDMDIERLSLLQYPPRVRAYDHTTGTLVWKRIVAARREWADELVELATCGGRTIRATGEHPFYDPERGYRAASLLRPGDGLAALQVPVEQDVQRVRTAQTGPRFDVHGLLQPSPTHGRRAALCQLRCGVRTIALPSREGAGEAGLLGHVLFAGVLNRASRGQMDPTETVSRVWGDYGEGQALLFGRLQGGDAQDPFSLHVAQESVPGLRSRVPTAFISQGPLLRQLCGPSPFSPDAREWELALQDRHELFDLVHEDAPAHPSPRRQCLRGVWHSCRDGVAATGCCPSHQREPEGQSPRESGHALSDLPRSASQVAHDTVLSTRRLRSGRVAVYDLQVEGTSNYFANGLLVHNCLIIDDPVRNRKDADSETLREDAWRWWQSTARTRLEPGGGVLLLMTRWHADDLAGRLLKQAAENPTADQWEVIRLPALAEENDPLGRSPSFFCIWTPDGRFKGQEWGAPLDTERYDVEALIPMITTSSREWAALYQQRPTLDEGAIFKRKPFEDHAYDADPEDATGLIYQFWDTAHSRNRDADYSVCTTWRMEKTGYRLLDRWKARVDFPTLKKEVVRVQQEWRASGVVIETVGSGHGAVLFEELRRDTRLPLLRYKPDRDKIARAHAVTPLIESGRVWVPKKAPWLTDYLDNLCQFPAGEHDDDCDSTTMALAYMSSRAIDPSVLLARGAYSWNRTQTKRTRGEEARRQAFFGPAA